MTAEPSGFSRRRRTWLVGALMAPGAAGLFAATTAWAGSTTPITAAKPAPAPTVTAAQPQADAAHAAQVARLRAHAPLSRRHERRARAAAAACPRRALFLDRTEPAPPDSSC
jgi:hypothetical protein